MPAVRFTTTTSRDSARACLLAVILALLAACSQMSPELNDRLDDVLHKGIMLDYTLPLN